MTALWQAAAFQLIRRHEPGQDLIPMCADVVDVLASKLVMALQDIPAIFFRSPRRLLVHEGEERVQWLDNEIGHGGALIV
ncbi:MAG: hypothetical protein AAAB20_18815 [Rhizobium sp.]|jgi:hypothetical protein|uniref:hypothetical protein n=1 Tax=Rhizobium sp. TaxID=391 RepID=UPI00055A1CD6